MKLHWVLRPQAEAEFVEAAIWYESQRAALGHDFASEVEEVFDKIAKQPDRYAIVDGDVRSTGSSVPLLRLLSR